ncbi:MAG: DUF5752 family protein [Promethearchaeota archaeon]
MQSNILNNSTSVIEQPIINGHEILLFEEDIAWNAIKGWIMTQYLNQKGLLVYNGELVNRTFLKAVFQVINENQIHQKPKKLYSISTLLRLIDQDMEEKVREIIRNQIWEAIERDNVLGLSYIFNFVEHIEINKLAVLNLERILKGLFQNKFGFPIDCCCLYPASLDVLDFAELVNLHDGYQIFDHYQKPRLKHHVQTDQISWTHKEIDVESQKQDSSIPYIAKRAYSKSNSPFYFSQGDRIIGIANDLKDLYNQLGKIPLDVFCFHCYRISQSNLAGHAISPSPRSDIALWIEYSVGDTQLAHQIYDTVNHSLCDQKTLEAGSKFTQITIRSTVLQLIKARLDYLSSVEFM